MEMWVTVFPSYCQLGYTWPMNCISCQSDILGLMPHNLSNYIGCQQELINEKFAGKVSNLSRMYSQALNLLIIAPIF